jgi:hypothetical protein
VTQRRALQLLVFILRLDGVVTLVAFGAMLLPVSWMADMHRSLGMGEFPQAPLTDYLVRSVSALYGFYGVLFLLVARDPLHHQPIVKFIGVAHVAFGVLVLAIDWHAGMPTLWTMLEGPPLVAAGIAVLYLLSRAAKA